MFSKKFVPLLLTVHFASTLHAACMGIFERRRFSEKTDACRKVQALVSVDIEFKTEFKDSTALKQSKLSVNRDKNLVEKLGLLVGARVSELCPDYNEWDMIQTEKCRFNPRPNDNAKDAYEFLKDCENPKKLSRSRWNELKLRTNGFSFATGTMYQDVLKMKALRIMHGNDDVGITVDEIAAQYNELVLWKRCDGKTPLPESIMKNVLKEGRSEDLEEEPGQETLAEQDYDYTIPLLRSHDNTISA